MIFGAHVLIHSRNAEADRAFLRDVLGLAWVDAGKGWLIFSLPPAELAFHPADAERGELYLMCDDLGRTLAGLRRRGVEPARPVTEAPFGRLTAIPLPGGGTIGLYEPRHPMAIARPGKPGATRGASRLSAARRKPARSRSRPAAAAGRTARRPS